MYIGCPYCHELIDLEALVEAGEEVSVMGVLTGSCGLQCPACKLWYEWTGDRAKRLGSLTQGALNYLRERAGQTIHAQEIADALHQPMARVCQLLYRKRSAGCKQLLDGGPRQWVWFDPKWMRYST